MLRLIPCHRHSDLSGAQRPTRREWIRLGSLGMLGAAGLTHVEAVADSPSRAARRMPGFGRAKSVVVLFAGGGQSQIDMWDPKPAAPLQIRGEFSSIPTAIPGVHFCEHLPLTAGVADRFTLVRSMSHEDLDHGSAIYLAMTGRYHKRRSANPPPSAEDAPCPGAILTRLRPVSNFPKSAVHINGPVLAPREPSPGQYGGFLGKQYDPFTVGDVASESVAVPGLLPLPVLPDVRLRARRSLLHQIDDYSRRLGENERLLGSHDLYEQAFRLLDRPQTRRAFDLNAEPVALRQRYGWNRTGQGCLLARRLVEAGCPLVTVFLNHNIRGQDMAGDQIDEWGWDTHNDIFVGLRRYLLPRFDQAFSTFLTDMDERGLLDETLVVCMGEFGRAPLVALEKRFAGASPGRKHWASVYSILFAGAGVGRGTIVGASDAEGAFPKSEAYGPWDVTATLFSALGIDPASHYRNLVDQPFRISDGRVIEPLYA